MPETAPAMAGPDLDPSGECPNNMKHKHCEREAVRKTTVRDTALEKNGYLNNMTTSSSSTSKDSRQEEDAVPAKPTVTPEGNRNPSRHDENRHDDPAVIGLGQNGVRYGSSVGVTPLKPSTKSSSKAANSKGNGIDNFISLDRGQDVSDLEDNPAERRAVSKTDSRSKARRSNSYDEDSSNDDSSYFADPNHLPSPKSGRRFSFSSNNSAPAGTSAHHAHTSSRESDASLSLSEDSDDAVHHSDSGVFGSQPRRVPDLQVYPQQITRMHSVSSLVSTNSQNSSASDPIIRDELRNVASFEGGHPGTRSADIPSGRRSPVLGQHPPSHSGSTAARMMFSSPSTNPEPSPPTILPECAHHPGNFPHPQPHPHPHMMSREQFSSWIAATSQMNYGATDGRDSLQSVSTGRSQDTSTLAYSDDGDNHHTVPFMQAADGARQAQGGSIPQGGNGLVPNNENGQERPEESGESGGAEGGGVGRGQGKNGGVGSSMKAEGEKKAGAVDSKPPPEVKQNTKKKGFKVYWQRWIMLLYMSVLNLLSDWTCYSVAPIALLTEEAFGNIDPELLVTVFLGANGIATACEPILLSRLGLRRTVLFGSLLLMIGSIIKSGGMPPIIQADIEKGEGEWRVYLGFFIVGLSQPLYQCTPALLSASWFPESERTMATGVALNANQLGIGFAFIFGTLLVSTSDDIPSYFGLLSMISTITFLGTLIQFDDAPPTPPSETARVMRGTLEINLTSYFESVKNMGSSNKGPSDNGKKVTGPPSDTKAPSAAATEAASRDLKHRAAKDHKRDGKSRSRRSKTLRTTTSGSRPAGKRNTSPRSQALSGGNSADAVFHGTAPSPAKYGSVSDQISGLDDLAFPAPSPMSGETPTQLGGATFPAEQNDEQANQGETAPPDEQQAEGGPYHQGQFDQPPLQPGASMPYAAPWPHPGYPMPPVPPGMAYPPGAAAPYDTGFQGYPQYPYAYPVWDPRIGQYVYPPQPHAMYPPPQTDPVYYGYQNAPPETDQRFKSRFALPPTDAIDAGAEPCVTFTDHHLDIDIQDDQVIRSLRACFARRGFIHSLVAFTVSGIVINTLSTFMDYLVRLNGAGREYTGIVGGAFQFCIMISSLIFGQLTDRTRAYYSVTVGMLVLGAFGLAECGVSLDADRGSDLRWSLVIVAILVGPLQPISTELGVDVVYPLSENTVLVVQQLFSNLLSALFIPCFKAMKDIGRPQDADDQAAGREKPQYTFSFYLLIVLHAAATVFFATFNGRYLRYEHELEKKAQEEAKERAEAEASFQQGFSGGQEYDDSMQQALIPPVV